MLCGLPVPSFHRKAKKRVPQRPVISAPLPQGLPSMNIYGRDNNFRDGGDHDSESGVYYLVTKTETGEKQLVKKQRPPPTTSSPMDEGFDAYTQSGIGTISRFPDSELSRSRSLQGPGGGLTVASPRVMLRNAYDTSLGSSRRALKETSYPSASPPRVPQLPTDTHVSPQHPNQQQQRYPGHTSPPTSPQGNKGKSREAVKETFGEYKEYMNEMETMFSKHGDFDISLNRMNDASGARESVALGRVQSTKSQPSSSRYRYNGRPMIGKAVGSANVTRNASAASTLGQGRVGKTRGVGFEEVSRRVVESTPEKTVTISTWREQVAQEAADVERTSVYYFTQGDMQELYAQQQSEEMDDMARGSKSSGSGRHGSMTQNHRIDHRISRSDGQRSSAEDRSVSHKPSSTKAPTSYESHKPHTESPQGQKLTIKTSNKKPMSSSSPASSTPTTRSDSDEHPPTPPPKPPRFSLKTVDIMQSTPIDNRVAIPSFHPTKDGSVISTIRSTSSASSLTFEHVLESCKPSLTHLAPMLGKLGITSVEHLRALGDLNPEIRDRELKEDALKLGVTSMEWAILVDRLRAV